MSSLRLWDVMQPGLCVLEIHNWCKWLTVIGRVAKNCNFYVFLTGVRLNNLLLDNILGLKKI